MAQKNMALALILSIICPGLGLIYDGEYSRGLIYVIIYIIVNACYFYVSGPELAEDWATTVDMLFYLSPIIWVVGLYDTFATTKSINA